MKAATFLTDNPGTTAEFLPAGLRWRQARAGQLCPEAKEVWEAFGTGQELWLAQQGAVEPSRLWLLIDDAPESQFVRMTSRVGGGGDLPDGLVCLALTGSRFRGQRDRAWAALRGNLHLSLHYRLDLPAAAVQAPLVMLPVLAAAKAVETVSQGRVRPGIKWVNDLLLEGRKVAGVLTTTQLQGERVVRVVYGIGVNVAQAPELAPTPFVPAAGCLAQADASLAGALLSLLGAVVRELDEGVGKLRGGDGAALYGDYRARAIFLGREVTIYPEGTSDWQHTPPIASGRVLELLPDLSLVLEGVPKPVTSGRMRFN